MSVAGVAGSLILGLRSSRPSPSGAASPRSPTSPGSRPRPSSSAAAAAPHAAHRDHRGREHRPLGLPRRHDQHPGRRLRPRLLGPAAPLQRAHHQLHRPPPPHGSLDHRRLERPRLPVPLLLLAPPGPPARARGAAPLPASDPDLARRLSRPRRRARLDDRRRPPQRHRQGRERGARARALRQISTLEAPRLRRNGHGIRSPLLPGGRLRAHGGSQAHSPPTWPRRRASSPSFATRPSSPRASFTPTSFRSSTLAASTAPISWPWSSSPASPSRPS